MTEAEWVASIDPKPMIDFLQDMSSERKLRLFAVECVRPHWHLLIDERSRNAVEVAELVADGISPTDALLPANLAAWAVLSVLPDNPFVYVSAARAAGRTVMSNRLAARYTINEIVELHVDLAEEKSSTADETCDSYWQEIAQYARLVREVWGSLPFRPVELNSNVLNWNEATVLKIAQALYDDRAFDRMPILADALEDASCDNADLLAHCRGPNEHVRGCWVVDLLLGKE
jgi:hypothetical protein